MIFCTVTINTTVKRVSTKTINTTTNQWFPFLKQVANIQWSMKSKLGGYCRPSFGDILLNTKAFDAADWPPPREISVVLKVGETTEEAATTLFDGLGVLKGISANGVKYNLYDEDQLSTTFGVRTYITGTLDSLFTTYCGASYLNLALNTAKSASPTDIIKRWVDADMRIIDFFHEIGVDLNHLFYTQSGTLYLVDMNTANGTLALAENEFLYANYDDTSNYSSYAINVGDISWLINVDLAGSTPYGPQYRTELSRSFLNTYFQQYSGLPAVTDGHISMSHKNLIAFNSTKTYAMYIRIRARAITVAEYNYAGLQGVAADRETYVDINGANNWHGQHYIVLNRNKMSNGNNYVEFTGYFSGLSNPGDNTEKHTVGTPGTLHTNVKYVRPMLALNDPATFYNTYDTFIDVVRIYECDPVTGDFIKEEFFDDFSSGNYSDWQIHSEGDATKTVTTSVASTAAKALLPTIKSILEKPRGEIAMPIKASNLILPGQQINWTDTRIAGVDKPIVASINSRKITYDLNRNIVKAEGEGSRL